MSKVLSGYTVSGKVKDYAGRESVKEVKIGIDKLVPTIDSCIMSIADPSKTLNSFEWGNYANGTVNFEIKASDVQSGIQYVNVHIGSVTVSGNEVDKTVTIPVDKSCFLQGLSLQPVSISAVDNCNQQSEPISLKHIPKTNISLNSSLIIEDILPYADLCLVDKYLEEIENKSIVGKEFTVQVSAGDVNSGVYKLKLKQKNEAGTVIKSNDFIMEGGNTKTVTEIINIDIGDVSHYSNGIIKLQIEATDYAGNIYTSEDYEYHLDLKAPTIEKYELFTENEGTKQIAEIVSSEDYGYYFPKNATVRIYASDGATESSSGVKSIEYYTVEKDTEPGNPITISGKNIQKVTKEGKDTLYYADIQIHDGFKGHIYARATDFARNQEQKYVSTKGAIVETQNRHDKETHIEIKMPGNSHTDSKGNPLYANDVTIPVTITDTMSGIAEISWEINAPHDKENNNSGRIIVGDDKTQYKEIDGWDIVQFDRNLAVKVQGDIKVENNSNDIVLKITMKDNAGNESTYSKTLSIDKTKPVIEISFDNNDSDDVYNHIYSQNRTAYVVIKERNFSADKVEVAISNSMGNIPSISDWDSDIDNDNPDSSTHTAKITFSQDGDYTLQVSGEDAAGNSAESKSVEPFTIDKTSPEVTVTYSNNDVKNGNYYAAERTVIITVKDRNFAPERVQLSGTYVEGGNTHSFPIMSGFTKRGDVYTATALCQKDGQYSFTVECRDKAGNQGTPYISGAYHIDQTSPIIEFAGVVPESANNGDLMPQVIMTDKNYSGKGINIKLSGANNGYVDLPGTYGTLPEGETFTFNNFPKTLEYDDLYTIDVKVTDLAGNVTSDNITFSVNRFGSVYVFDETLRDIAGTYIQSPIDINLTEINLDTLERDTIKVVLDHNGTSRDLVEGEDYKVQEILGSGSWFRYNYNINRSLFEGDGRYIVALYSVDRAGNINQNTDETKKAEIHFGVDKTAPVVIPIDLEDSKQYAVDVKTATVTVNDNLVLKEVAIYINGKLCEHINDGENYTFDIPSSKDKQQITILATDMAGNTTEHIVSKILVNTNLFVRWYNNKPLFIGSLLTLFALCGGGLVALILYRRRKYGE